MIARHAILDAVLSWVEDCSNPDLAVRLAWRCPTGMRPNGRPLPWTERVLLVRSAAFAQAAVHGLHQRVERPQAELLALASPQGRGRKRFTEEEPLRAAAEAGHTQLVTVELWDGGPEARSTRNMGFQNRITAKVRTATQLIRSTRRSALSIGSTWTGEPW